KTDQVWDHLPPRGIPEDQPIYFCADEEATGCVPFDWGKGRPSIFMRRWMSRITLEIISIRVERLNEISDGDALAEGVEQSGDWPNPVDEFRVLWESINGAGSWDENPWVWVLEFKRVERGDA
ncbi:MAG: hypothetical protein QM680_13545, partial [Luteolibacter sp.]